MVVKPKILLNLYKSSFKKFNELLEQDLSNFTKVKKKYIVTESRLTLFKYKEYTIRQLDLYYNRFQKNFLTFNRLNIKILNTIFIKDILKNNTYFFNLTTQYLPLPHKHIIVKSLDIKYKNIDILNNSDVFYIYFGIKYNKDLQKYQVFCLDKIELFILTKEQLQNRIEKDYYNFCDYIIVYKVNKETVYQYNINNLKVYNKTQKLNIEDLDDNILEIILSTIIKLYNEYIIYYLLIIFEKKTLYQFLPLKLWYKLGKDLDLNFKRISYLKRKNNCPFFNCIDFSNVLYNGILFSLSWNRIDKRLSFYFLKQIFNEEYVKLFDNIKNFNS